MKAKATQIIFLVLIFVAAAGLLQAETTGHDGVNPEKLKASFGFLQKEIGVGQFFDPQMTMLMFGCRGGEYLGTSETFYLGGGGRGGFSLSDMDGGLGYFFMNVGSKAPLGQSSIGLDLYGGLGLGIYGSDVKDGWMLGPVLGVDLYSGTRRSFDWGLFVETFVNVYDIEASLVTIGVHFGDKGGSVHIDWEDRHDLDI